MRTRGGTRLVRHRGVAEIHAAQDTTVSDLIDDWLAMAGRELSPTTARGYDWIVKNHIKQTPGTVRLA